MSDECSALRNVARLMPARFSREIFVISVFTRHIVHAINVRPNINARLTLKT